MKEMKKCSCGREELVLEKESRGELTMEVVLSCVCGKRFEERWIRESIIELPTLGYWLIEEVTEVDNDTYTDHVLCRAVTEGDVCEMWEKVYKDYTIVNELGEYPKIDIGEKTMEVTSIKAVTKEEYAVYAKVFTDIS